MSKFWYYAIQVVEYLIAALFLEGGTSVFVSLTLPTKSGVLGTLIRPEAVYLYAASWLVLGLALIYAKIFKKRRLHGWTLLGMYLTIVYVCILDYMVDGWHLGSIWNIFVGLLTGALYLRWKYVVPDLDGV